jgi:hypothetical protein
VQVDTQGYTALRAASQTPMPPKPNQIRQKPPENTLGSRKKTNPTITTPIQVNSLASFLAGYDSQLVQFLVNGFSSGFKIPFTGQRQFRLSKNLPSFDKFKSVGLNKINEELKTGRIAGPYASPPLTNLQVSPLGIVPKKTPGEFRMIHHLSFPEGLSINDNIPQQFCSVHYQSIDDAISAIKKVGVGALLSKSDLENAYKQVPIHPTDFELLGFQVDGLFYYDKTLPFGLSYSCQLFEKFSSALQWILQHKFQVGHCIHVLDDFLFVGKPHSTECYDALLAFYTLATEINLPIKKEKTVLPTTTLTFLGLELDTVRFEVRLPEDKLISLRNRINHFKKKRTATLLELQSLIGLLNFACAVVPPGRAFLRRIIDLTMGLKKPFHHRNLNKEARADLQAWSLFLDHFNGRALFHSGVAHTSASLHLYTDASNAGFGAVFGRKWFYGTFSDDWLAFHISVREFLPIVVAVEMWGPSIANTSVTFHSDNSAVVYTINKHSSKNQNLMKLMRRLMVASLRYNIHFHAEHIPGLLNTSADLLSRLQIQQFREHYPDAEQKPIAIPLELLRL